MNHGLLGRLFVPLALGLAAPALGCGGTVAAGQTASADSAVTRAPVAQSTHGPIKLLGAALGDVPLTSAQRAEIEKLAADAEVRHADATAARKDLLVTLAGQVEGGAIDRAALQPKIDMLVASIRRVQPEDRASLERLHALLGPDQRTAFVDAVETRVRDGFRKHGKHPMKQWAEDLKLTDDQRDQVKAALKEQFSEEQGGHEAGAWMGHARRGAKVLEAFKQDRFVLNEVAPAFDPAEGAARMADRFTGLAQRILPILTPEQRTLAAQKLREHADTTEGGPF